MKRGPRAPGKRPSPVRGLRARLVEAEATLDAIRSGAVDAVVVSGPGGERTLAFEGATHPYYVLLDAMSDGTALLHGDGTILFANRRLAEIARAPMERLPGTRLQQLIVPAERPGFGAFLREGGERRIARECTMAGRADAPVTPVRIALSAVPLGNPAGADAAAARHDATVLMAVVTDLSERNRTEAERLELMKRLIAAEDQERRRIARELHDETGQSLTALLVGLRAIEEQSLTVDAKAMAQRLRSVAARTVEDVGRLARGLHPSVLDDVGLVAAVRRHVIDYTGAHAIAVDLRLEGVAAIDLPPLVQTTLYRILQEALTNVARHAHARAVTVVLGRADGTIDLEVRDDGRGFDVAAASVHAAGLGLHGMRERVALLGGSLEIASSAGHGTTVHARIALGAPPGDADAGSTRRPGGPGS